MVATHDFLAHIPVTYRSEWQDGFGARGWKLDIVADDPAVIASTAETGDRLPTSVLIHDALDHYLCGLPMSGHRNEAVALMMLAQRTGSDPSPDYAQMVDEDLMHGHVNGEPFRTFLPKDLRNLVPRHIQDGKAIAKLLSDKIGEQILRRRLIKHFFELGSAGKRSAQHRWRQSGLDYTKRLNIGLCLQRVLRDADSKVIQDKIVEAKGEFRLNNDNCQLVLSVPSPYVSEAEVGIDTVENTL